MRRAARGSRTASRSRCCACARPTAALPEPLERLGILTLGEVAALARAASPTASAPPGLPAHDLARGRDTPLRPRAAGERSRRRSSCPRQARACSSSARSHLLIDRLLARRERRGRTLRALALAARLVEGGTWRERVVFREALADPRRMRLALGAAAGELPAPAETLRLTVERFGPPRRPARAVRRRRRARGARLREAVRQARAAAGPDAALRVLESTPARACPSDALVLTPFEP